MLFLEAGRQVEVEGFLSAPDPLIDAAACPGAPACGQGQVETRTIARALAGKVGSLHVSGCAKGCARRGVSDVTLVGREGRFDLVRRGGAGDTPERSGLTEAEVMELFA
jgi:precorrin-3B synthase